MLESTLLPLTNYKLSEVKFPRISFLKQSDCIAPASIFFIFHRVVYVPTSLASSTMNDLGASDLSCLKSSLMFSRTKSSKTVKILFVLRRSCRESNFLKKMARKIRRWAFSIFDRFVLAAEPYISNP